MKDEIIAFIQVSFIQERRREGQKAKGIWSAFGFGTLQLSVSGDRTNAAVAQWIEYWPPKPRVVGSIPASRTIAKRSIPDTWFTDRTDHILNSLGPKGFSTGSTLRKQRPNFSEWQFVKLICHGGATLGN